LQPRKKAYRQRIGKRQQIFLLCPTGGGGARSAPQIEAGARFRLAPQNPNTQTCLPAAAYRLCLLWIGMLRSTCSKRHQKKYRNTKIDYKVLEVYDNNQMN
jgi:hypothetical protein